MWLGPSFYNSCSVNGGSGALWCLYIYEKSIRIRLLFMLLQGWRHLTASYFDQKRKKKREREKKNTGKLQTT